MLITVFDSILIVAALLVMSAGFLKRRPARLLEKDEKRAGDLTGLIVYLLGHKKILRNGSSGIAHLVLFWGFVLPLLIIVLSQFPFVIPKEFAELLSLVLDVLGILVIFGILFFFFRRMNNLDDVPEPRKIIIPLVILLAIFLSGFLAEGLRLRITGTGFHWTSPVGWLFSAILPGSPILMQMVIRVHFFLILLFIVMLPFTFMRHLITASLNVFYRDKGPRGALVPVLLDDGLLGAGKIEDFSWKQSLEIDACVSCGRCEDNCPATISGKPLSPKKVMQNLLHQAETVCVENSQSSALSEVFSDDELWSCTGCMACVEHCPVFVNPMDKIVAMRRFKVLAQGKMPDEAMPMIRNLEIYGDTDGKGIAHKVDWAHSLDVPHIAGEGLNAEILLWVGCSGAFHPKYQDVTRAMVKILKAAGISFGILGKEELCCGDAARRLGNEEVFLDLARKNIAALKKYHVKNIVTLCPHGFNTLKNEYKNLGGDFNVVHASELIADLIKQKKIFLKYPVKKTMVIHDPCYLGRINNIYEPLREVCGAVPGVVVKELKRNRENAFCCGGGGGRMWLHERLGENISNLRAQEIKESNIELVGTACPFCLTMLEDGIGSLEMEKPPKVMDIVEIIAYSLR
ncbi:MAG: 4Fe-4S dicluster domain-containing protein [Syntrophobacterales bacterium]|nr:4Fe-4S dicluster domain-containing protein [Syntrophobacterales bacterium]